MIAEGIIRIYWKHSACQPNYEDVDLKTALAMKKELRVSGYEVKIVTMKQTKWVTVAQSPRWEP